MIMKCIIPLILPDLDLKEPLCVQTENDYETHYALIVKQIDMEIEL